MSLESPLSCSFRVTTEITVLWTQAHDVHDVLPRIPSVQDWNDVGEEVVPSAQARRALLTFPP